MASADPVIVVPYDPAWPAAFAALAARAAGVLAAAPPVDAQIEHVGSTAVPGLAAKPVIDLDVIVAPSDIAVAVARLARLGYRDDGEKGIPGRRSLRWPAGEPRHHLYVCAAGSAAVADHLDLREALRRDAVAREAYGALKLALAARHRLDRVAYLDGKSAFVAALLARVRG